MWLAAIWTVERPCTGEHCERLNALHARLLLLLLRRRRVWQNLGEAKVGEFPHSFPTVASSPSCSRAGTGRSTRRRRRVTALGLVSIFVLLIVIASHTRPAPPARHHPLLLGLLLLRRRRLLLSCSCCPRELFIRRDAPTPDDVLKFEIAVDDSGFFVHPPESVDDLEKDLARAAERQALLLLSRRGGGASRRWR